jgi:hypothetical protein
MTAMPLMMGKGILSEWVEMEVKDLIDTKSMMVESGTTHISKNIREWCEATFYELSGNFDELQHLPMPDIEKLDECFFTLCTYKVW